MGKRFQHDEADNETKVDLSPLIDCVFILLIFFIVTTTFVDEKGKEVPTPEAAATPDQPTDQEPSNVLIDVTARGEVLSEGASVGLNGVQTLIANSRDGKRSPVIITVVGDAPVGLLMQVKEQVELAGTERDKVSVMQRHEKAN